MRKLIFVICMACIAMFASCSDNSFTAGEYSASGDSVSALVIDVHDRRIELSVSDDGRVHADYFESPKEYYSITLSEEGVLSIESVDNKSWTDFIGVKPSGANRLISVSVPAGLLDRLVLSTTNEDIVLPAMSAGEVSLSSNGGNISFERLDVSRSLSLDVKNGDISGSLSGSYDDYTIQLDTKKGDCNLFEKTGGGKTLTVRANNGDVNIDLAG